MSEESIGKLVAILDRIGLIYTGKKFEPYEIGLGQFMFLTELFVQNGISQEKLAPQFVVTRRQLPVPCSDSKVMAMSSVNAPRRMEG